MANALKNLSAIGSEVIDGALNLISEGGVRQMKKSEAILDYYKQYPESTIKQIAKATSSTTSYVRNVIKLRVPTIKTKSKKVPLTPKKKAKVVIVEDPKVVTMTHTQVSLANKLGIPLNVYAKEIRKTRELALSDGSTASYYVLPEGCSQLQHLISHRDMNAQIGEIFRSCYRYGECPHSDKLRDAKKIKFYIDAEIERLLR
tara:strand:+ start:9447 stop:10052 length:606 start_codon:yes stop_codon:yes gene_type:complete